VKTLWIGIPLAALLLAAPVVKREDLNNLEKGFATSLTAGQMQILGYPSGFYIDGYGVVYSTEINLSYAQPVSPFAPTVSPEVKANTHAAELRQLPILRDQMRQLLLRSSVTLDKLPPAEQIVVGVKITHQGWEDKTGFPEQIVMQGQKSKLMDAKMGRASAESVIREQVQN